MTREEFDKKQWHKDMRCFIEIEVAGKLKKSYGTIIKVHFGGQFVGVKFDGKDYVERVSCERITLQEDYERRQREQHALSENAKAITDQIVVEFANYGKLFEILNLGLVIAVTNDHGEMSVDIDPFLTANDGDWLVRLKDGTMSVCRKMYHKKMEEEGLISSDGFGFNSKQNQTT